jgi:hypothetical protein
MAGGELGRTVGRAVAVVPGLSEVVRRHAGLDAALGPEDGLDDLFWGQTPCPPGKFWTDRSAFPFDLMARNAGEPRGAKHFAAAPSIAEDSRLVNEAGDQFRIVGSSMASARPSAKTASNAIGQTSRRECILDRLQVMARIFRVMPPECENAYSRSRSFRVGRTRRFVARTVVLAYLLPLVFGSRSSGMNADRLLPGAQALLELLADGGVLGGGADARTSQATRACPGNTASPAACPFRKRRRAGKCGFRRWPGWP